MSFISEQLEAKIGRRNVLQLGAMAGASLFGGGLLAGCGGHDHHSNSSSSTDIDAEVLNFALNLEYLEAEYYLHAVTGSGLTATDAGTGAGTVVTKSTSTQVSFTTPAIAAYAEEIASDELNHVKFLRSALMSGAVARPNINLLTSFDAAYAAATATPGATFDPFANEINFLIGAYIFEDVGVTAYKGAARLLTNKDYLEAAAGILAVEAYHAGSVRTVLNAQGQGSTTNAISAARQALSGVTDQGVATPDPSFSGASPLTTQSSTNLVPTDANSIVFSRTTAQVLPIVYLGATPSASSFFPNGLNGAIK